MFFLEKSEKLLLFLVAFLFTGVIVVQSLIFYEPLPLQLSLLSAIEGEKIEHNQVFFTGHVDTEVSNLTFRVLTPYITSLPKAKILINGQKAADFTKLQTSVNVKVNDQITIDISDYELDLQFKIVPSGNEIKIPQELVTVKGGQSTTFTVWD